MKVKRRRLYVTVALALLIAVMTGVTYAGDIRILDNHGGGSDGGSAEAEGSVSPAGTAVGRYSDTSAATATGSGGSRGSIVRNGDFSTWGNGPIGWNVSTPAKSGWESRPNNMNMAIVHDTAMNPGQNDALAFFMRNTGGAGPHDAYAWQALSVPVSGYYWIQVHASMFGDFTRGGAANFHNATAWYGIGDAGGTGSVDMWREMFPMTLSNPGERPCYNSGEHCVQVGRYETIHLEEGDVLYLRAGHKWSTFNVWTVFEFDDISIVPTAETAAKDYSGYWDVGDVGWDDRATR